MKKLLISVIILLGGMQVGCASSDGDNNVIQEESEDYPIEKPLAFPTAEGYGKNTVGGRGGKVFEVTNLNDAGNGTLRAAVEAKGPRVVVFRVSGNIELKKALKIANPYITIAGQTAPGDGICIKNYPLVIAADEVIIRYIRVRGGDEAGHEEDAISARFVKNLILDHVSASWSVDETMSIYHCNYITVQWCMITESLYQSNHAKGNHGFGGIWGGNYSTYHHNLLAHHSSRSIRMSSGAGNTDYRNNVIYNWGYNSCYGGEKVQVGSEFNFTNINLVGNYYKPGPATLKGAVSYRIANPSFRDVTTDFGKWYIADNVMVGNEVVTKDNWNGGVQPGKNEYLSILRVDKPWESMPVNQQTAEEAYKSVLENAGAILPKRDAVDKRIADEVWRGNALYEGTVYKEKYKANNSLTDASKPCGIIDSQVNVGGWPVLNSAEAPLDSDHDGMPDEWEVKNGLNPKDASDGSKVARNGYTNLENYLNSL